MKEAKNINGTTVGVPNTKGAAGAKVSNRAVGVKSAGVKAAGTNVLERMNPGKKK